MTPEGIVLNINKPTGITSYSVVRKVKKITNAKKVGHGGALDPFASGVLLILGGRGATKRFDELSRLKKKYRTVFRLGLQTDTHDINGEMQRDEHVNVSLDEIESVIEDYTGDIDQIPPMYSAKKVGGKRLYEYAREGMAVDREPTQVTVYDIDGKKMEGRDIYFEVTCSSGTYIRALARDIGNGLGTGAVVSELTRTAVGDYTIDEAIPIENVEGAWNSITA